MQVIILRVFQVIESAAAPAQIVRVESEKGPSGTGPWNPALAKTQGWGNPALDSREVQVAGFSSGVGRLLEWFRRILHYEG